MRKLAAVLVMFVAVSSFADAGKAKTKSKEKHFDDVKVQASTATGSYRGPDDTYGLILEAATDNSMLRGNYVEMGRAAVLNAIELNGSEFTARASFADGSYRTIKGTFSNRVLNGKTAFGLRMRSVPVEGMGTVDTFFERF
jgi:hypothetical protein